MPVQLKIATDCSGIGSPEQALKELHIAPKVVFMCEKDKYARQTWLANHVAQHVFEDMTTRDNSPTELYADLYLAGIPCQPFSLAGQRLGESDVRGTLFYNSYDYIDKQRPKAFIIENVKGLLSADKGKTFRNWLELLAATINYQQQLYPHVDSLGYNVHYVVLNSKDFGVPQNRERVFIVGIRPDLPSTFKFPVGEPLTIKLKDILEPLVDEKYYLSDKAIQSLILNVNNLQKPNVDGEIANTLQSPGHASGAYKGGNKVSTFDPKILRWQNKQAGIVEGNHSPAKRASGGTDIRKRPHVIENAIITNINGELQEKNIFNCIDANYHKGIDNHAQRSMIIETKNQNEVIQLNPSLESNNQQPYQQNRRCDSAGILPALMQGKSDLLIKTDEITAHSLYPRTSKTGKGGTGHLAWQDGLTYCLDTGNAQAIEYSGSRIRRLTPLECFRLQGFPDSFIKPVSDTQLYRQAGNSITVNVIKAVLKNLIPIIHS